METILARLLLWPLDIYVVFCLANKRTPFVFSSFNGAQVFFMSLTSQCLLLERLTPNKTFGPSVLGSWSQGRSYLVLSQFRCYETPSPVTWTEREENNVTNNAFPCVTTSAMHNTFCKTTPWLVYCYLDTSIAELEAQFDLHPLSSRGTCNDIIYLHKSVDEVITCWETLILPFP